MRVRRLAPGSVCLTILLAATPGCGRDASAVGLLLSAPQGALDSATRVELSVFAASAAECLATGHVTQIPAKEQTHVFTLEQRGCEPGVAWCKDIELEKDGTAKMFAVVARDAVGGTVAEGCAQAVIDQDPLEVGITVKRYSEPACCNDGRLQIGEQCDLGAPASIDCAGAPAGGECSAQVPDPVCECDCLTKELALDRLADPAPAAGTKVAPAMTFARGTGPLDLALRAVFTDTSSGAANTSDVMVRVLTRDLYPITDPKLLALASPLRIPLRCDDVSGAGMVKTQREPAIAAIGHAATAVVFVSDFASSDRFDVYVSHQTDSGCADAAPQRVNVSEASVRGPDVAGGPTDLALVTWTTGENELRARIWRSTDDALLPAASDLVIANRATSAKVAGTQDGWIVAYAGAGAGDGDGVFLRRVSADGTASGQVEAVNLLTDGPQDEIDIAAFADGRALVAWRSAGDVFFQRFDANGTPNPEDQAAPIHTATAGDQGKPAAVAGGDFGDFFVVAWEDLADGTVWARNVGGSTGFVYNSVTGQNDDYAAGHPRHPGGIRRSPMIAIGGGGHVAIGWQDDDPSYAGIYVRRFPLPVL